MFSTPFAQPHSLGVRLQRTLAVLWTDDRPCVFPLQFLSGDQRRWRITLILKLAYELYGFHFLFPVCAVAKAAQFAGITKECARVRLRSANATEMQQTAAWSKRCFQDHTNCSSPDNATVIASIRSFMQSVRRLWLSNTVVRLQLSPVSGGVDADPSVSEWYEVIAHNGTRATSAVVPPKLETQVHRCQVLANMYGIKHIIRNWTIWGTATAGVKLAWQRLHCQHRSE